jgi:hypothetical protein
MEQPKARVLKNAGIPLLVGGILALIAEAALLAALLVTVGICALGTMIGWSVERISVSKR